MKMLRFSTTCEPSLCPGWELSGLGGGRRVGVESCHRLIISPGLIFTRRSTSRISTPGATGQLGTGGTRFSSVERKGTKQKGKTNTTSKPMISSFILNQEPNPDLGLSFHCKYSPPIFQHDEIRYGSISRRPNRAYFKRHLTFWLTITDHLAQKLASSSLAWFDNKQLSH